MHYVVCLLTSIVLFITPLFRVSLLFIVYLHVSFIVVVYFLVTFSHCLRFVRLCEDAYLILRRHASLFINMLAMMLQTGIPELRSIDDLNYVR